MPDQPIQQDADMDITKIAEFMGTVTAELQNGNKLMEQLRTGQDLMKEQISGVKSDIQVMQSASALKRTRCDEIIGEHAKQILTLSERSVRDKKLLNDLENAVLLDDMQEKTKKETLTEVKEEKKDKREVSAYQMGVILFAIQLVSFALLIWWK